jgi:tetratricopeptide (TPR) repeat protein
MINLIDIYDSGLFLGAVVKTLQQTFSHIYVIAEDRSHPERRDTFVVIAAMRKINLENLGSEKPVAGSNLWILNDSEIETLKTKARGVVLTDDYVPVENMLAPVVRQSALVSLSNRYLERASKLERQGKLDESVAIYKEIIKLDPTKSITAYNSMGQILARQGKWQQAIDAAKSAIEYNEKAEVKHSMSDMHYNISLALKKLGRNEEASEYIHKAIEGYREDLAQEPNSIKTLRNLGNALVETNRFSEATECFQKAVDINSLEVRNHLMLADALSKQQRYDEATAVIKKAIPLFSDARNERAVIELQRYLWSIEDSKNANKR